ncbi:hypothetical protein MHN28_05845 [Ruegeria sp. Ofav3-42]|nr:hypothetical protein [Ruegeria sp. Ofav3-42]
MSLELNDGTRTRARRVFLAAGVLGTATLATLLARSLPQIADIGFQDHAPYSINCLGLGRALGSPQNYANRGSFNALTLKRKKLVDAISLHLSTPCHKRRSALWRRCWALGRACAGGAWVVC